MMFHDLTAKKSVPILAIFAAFAIAIGIFAYANATVQIVDRGMQFAERLQSTALFSLFYSPPWGGNVAAVAAASGSAQAVPVLIYHGTPPEGNDNPPLPQNVFVEQMRALKADGWETVTMQQFTDFMKNGKPLPKKSFLLTFDDGRRESFYPVDPVLESLGYHAIMFVITDFSLPPGGGKVSYYLDRNELQYMIDSGRWELESHGAEDHRLYDVPSASTTAAGVATIDDEHFLSNKFWLAEPGRVETTKEFTTRVENDLALSRQTLQDDFGITVNSFAFPFNDYGQASRNFPGSLDILAQAVSANYAFGMYQVDPARNDPFNYPDKNAYMIKRIEPTAAQSGADLVKLLDSSDARSLPYVPSSFGSEWNSNWGNATVSNNALSLHASTKTSGAASLLNGAAWWEDYTINATVNWKSGDALSLIARYQSDSKTFLTCAFVDKEIVLQAHEGGKTSTLKSAPYDLKDKSHIEIRMQVSGNTASCSALGVTVESELGAQFVHQGSLGIQIWGPTLGTEAADVTHLSVTGA